MTRTTRYPKSRGLSPCHRKKLTRCAEETSTSPSATTDAVWRRAPTGSYLLKVYDLQSEDAVRVNDLVEVFGVLEMAGEADGANEHAGTLQSMIEEERALLPPPAPPVAPLARTPPSLPGGPLPPRVRRRLALALVAERVPLEALVPRRAVLRRAAPSARSRSP